MLSKGDQPGTQQYTLEEMKAIVDEAHRLGRKVAAHAHGTEAIKEAIEAGVDSIEHASLIDDEGIRLAKEHGTYLVMDIYNDDYILGQGPSAGMLPESIEKERKLGQLQRDNFAKAHHAGAKMAFGTDAGVYPHGDNAKQFHYMVKYGMTPLESIQAATINAADLLGWSDRVGAIEPGKYGDLIAVTGNPLEDVTILEQVKCVIKGRHGSAQRPREASSTGTPACVHLVFLRKKLTIERLGLSHSRRRHAANRSSNSQLFFSWRLRAHGQGCAMDASAPVKYIRAGKLLDVRTGKLLADQVIVVPRRAHRPRRLPLRKFKFRRARTWWI